MERKLAVSKLEKILRMLDRKYFSSIIFSTSPPITFESCHSGTRPSVEIFPSTIGVCYPKIVNEKTIKNLAVLLFMIVGGLLRKNGKFENGGKFYRILYHKTFGEEMEKKLIQVYI